MDIYSLVFGIVFFWPSWIQEQQPQPIRIILLPSTLQIIRLSQGFQHDYIYYIKKSTCKESLCTKRCNLATLQPRMNQERSRWLWWLQWHPNRDDCARTGVHVRHSPSLSLPSSFSQLSSLHKAHSLRRKKRRNMLAIFGFRKNRNQTLSNQGPEAEAEVYGDGCHTVATAPTGFVYAQTQHAWTPSVKI